MAETFGNLFKRGVNKGAEPILEAPISSADHVDAEHGMSSFIAPQNPPLLMQQRQPSPCCCPVLQWTNADIRNVLFASAVPLGISVFNMVKVGRDEKARKFIERENALFCKMCPHPAICVALNVITVAPLGYASYVVGKCGGGFESPQTKMALGIYGFTLFNMLGTVPALRSGNIKWIASGSLLLAAGAAASAYTFGKVDRTAGYLMVPFALWSACQALPWLFRICPCSSSSSDGKTAAATSTTVTATRTGPVTPKTTTTAVTMTAPAFGEDRTTQQGGGE